MKIEDYIKIRLKELEEKTKNNQELIKKIKIMNLKLLNIFYGGENDKVR